MCSTILVLSMYLSFLFLAVSPVTHRTSPKPRSVFSRFIYRFVCVCVFCASHICPPSIPQGTRTLCQQKNKCTVIYLCPCVFFESFRRDLNEAKAVSCNVIGGDILRFYNGCLFSPSPLRWELIVNDVTRNLRRNRSVIITKRQRRYVYRRD